MDLITPELVAVKIYNVSLQLQPDRSQVPQWQDVALLLGTAAVESGFELGTRHGNRAAFGIFGLDINTCISTYGELAYTTHWYSRFMEDYKQKFLTWKIFSEAWLGVSGVPYIPFDKKDLRHLLVHDLSFAATVCRWIYMNMQTDDPDTLSDVAELWNTLHNNTPDRKAEDFMNAWDKYECRRLMGVIGYE